MFKHIVCFKFNNKNEAPIVAAKLNALKDEISQIKSIETGVDILGTERSYDLILITTFDSKEDYKEYDIHPAHQIVRKYIHSVRQGSVAVDYHI